MAQEAYQGHTEFSSSRARATADADSLLAPADRNGFDIADFTQFPGAAARANGYPRSDGR